MKNNFSINQPLAAFSLWQKFKAERRLYAFDLEITARCNNNCRHCYVNYPADCNEIRQKELSLDQIKHLVDQAVDMGALWCLITGGEPLLRPDFFDIYFYIKSKGLLVSVFTNATMITEEHVAFFKKYPPREIEVTVYGVTCATYEDVSRVKGSFSRFMRGVDLLMTGGVKVRFKAMALRSNVDGMQAIATFCRERTRDYFRFDPSLHLRCDGDIQRNEEIRSERLSPAEFVALEKADAERFGALEKNCDKLIVPALEHLACHHLFHCGSGNGSFYVSYDGFFRLCSSLCQKDCVYDLKKGSLKEAWECFVPQVRAMTSDNKEFLEKCRVCPIINLCLWCPAHAHLETGRLDQPVQFFCDIAHARQASLEANNKVS